VNQQDYRKTLYDAYSESFSGIKDYDPSTQWAVFQGTYRADLLPHKDAKILDIGCGKGEWLLWMKGLGYKNLTGVDGAAAEIAHLTASGISKFSRGALEFLEETPEKFDLIHAKDLFEHFTKNEALKYLELCNDRLLPGGEIWILTFNAQSPLSSATQYGDFTHELGVTPTSIAQVMIAARLEVKSVHCYVPSGKGVMGWMRRGIFALLEIFGEIFLKLRHGSQRQPQNIASRSILPDLFAIARKPKSR
jgi:2-polyprenyl-3-methyl-5-hydroxy-6-metoxy-1,4-benzoquinol methylase